MDVLVTRPLPGQALERLAAACRLDVWEHDIPIPREELLRRIPGKTGLLCLLTDPVDAALMDAAGGLRIIANYAVGYDNIDLAAAQARGIVVTNTPGVLTDATADLTWALLFAAARRIVEADAFVRGGSWRGWDPNLMLGHDITGRTLGIVGAGRIGTAVGLRARAFSMPVIYTDDVSREVLETQTGARRVSLDELLAGADFISLHVPLTPQTHNMIGARELGRMRPTAILINTARGPIIDEAALERALRSGQIAGAGLDVFAREPTVPSGFLELPNVVLLPHIASATHTTRGHMADMAVENILAFLRGENPPNRVV